MTDLNSILKSLANKKISLDKAQEFIEKNYSPKSNPDEYTLPLPEGIRAALKKIQGNVTQNLQVFGFFPQLTGIDSKLSVFRNFQVITDSVVEDNNVIGSNWFDIQFSENALVKSNKFTAVQFSDIDVARSDFCHSRLSLSRWSKVTLKETRIENNKFTRTHFSNVSIAESDFTDNEVTKTDFSDSSINSSRLTRLILNNSSFQECEFDFCDIQGIEFENCKFENCSLSIIQLSLKAPFKLANYKVREKNISNCETIEDFIKLLQQ